MKKIIKHVIKILLVLFMLICWCKAIGFTDKLTSSREIKNIYFDSSEMTHGDISNYLEEENKSESPILFTGWSEITDASVINEDLNRTVSTNIFMITGNSSLVVQGPILFEDDKNGCLLDSETANKLFGSEDVVGKTVLYGDRELIVKGICESYTATMVVQSLSNSTDKVSGVSVDNSNSNNLNALSIKYGFPEADVDSNAFSTIAKISVYVLPIIMLLIIVFKLVIQMFKVKRKPILFAIYLSILFVVLFIFSKITRFSISIPGEMIPNKWSDFDFWSSLYSEYESKFRNYLYMKKYNMDIYRIEILAKVIINATLSIILFYISNHYMKIDNSNKLFISIIALIIMSFVAILKVSNDYDLNCNDLMIWLMCPFYLIGDYFLGNRLKIALEYNEGKERSVSGKENKITA